MHTDRLTAISNEILALHEAINLRPTMEQLIRYGELLTAAKRLCGHGKWFPWLKAHGMNDRTARERMQLAKRRLAADLPDNVSDRQFLQMIRQAKRELRAAEREENRREAIAANPMNDQTFQIHHADCRTFSKWPAHVDIIATDPEWDDIAAYRWLGDFAKSRLRPGGLLLVQAGQPYLADVIAVLSKSGLVYRWTMAIVYSEMAGARVGWMPQWRPVLALSSGRMDRKRISIASDVFTVEPFEKEFHDWQQPIEPWQYWLDKLSPPGSMIVDPFCGSGTNGVAVKTIGGGRKFIGTDIDADNCKVARKRIADVTCQTG